MKDTIFTIKSNVKIAKNTYEMVLIGDTSDITASGQFVNIKLDGFYLRRPISVCEVEGNELTLIYTIWMAVMPSVVPATLKSISPWKSSTP